MAGGEATLGLPPPRPSPPPRLLHSWRMFIRDLMSCCWPQGSLVRVLTEPPGRGAWEGSRAGLGQRAAWARRHVRLQSPCFPRPSSGGGWGAVGWQRPRGGCLSPWAGCRIRGQPPFPLHCRRPRQVMAGGGGSGSGPTLWPWLLPSPPRFCLPPRPVPPTPTWPAAGLDAGPQVATGHCPAGLSALAGDAGAGSVWLPVEPRPSCSPPAEDRAAPCPRPPASPPF